MAKFHFKEGLTYIVCLVVKLYNARYNISYKVLLLYSNAPSHPPNVDILDDSMRIEYTIKNTTGIQFVCFPQWIKV